jgi:hypothetical protein
MPENVPPPLRTENDPPEPPPRVPARAPGEYVACEFCECKLTRTGEVYSLSEKAREYRDSKETHRKEVAKLTEETENLRRTLTAKDAELSVLRGPQQARRSPADAML